LELVLEDGGGLLPSVDFGPLFYGQRRVVRALLVNNGPQPLAYSTSFELDEDMHERMHVPVEFKGG